MPRKNAMRDNVSAVRSGLPAQLSNLPREKIELALLYYESNVEETIEAFKRNGAVEALSGWTEMSNGRGNNSSKRANNKSSNRDQNKSSSQTPPSNRILRPSQRVSNIFQTFAEGGVPTITTNGTTTTSSSSLLLDQPINTLQSYPSVDLSFHPYLSQDSTTTNNSHSLLNVNESLTNEFHDTSNATTNSSMTTDEMNLLTNHLDQDNDSPSESHHDLTNGKSKHRRSIRERNGSTSSITLNHDQSLQSVSDDIQQSNTNSIPLTDSSTVTKPSFSNNRKLLTKSTKDLQRQTSTLTNVELSFENEIKSSIKRIDDVFKQIREIIKEREVQLYLEMDQVKEQGLNIIHHRQQRGSELRQRIDRCDRLEALEIDHLRTDIKQFVTDRRYDLCEELTSSHRFDFDQNLIEALKNFGTVLTIDRNSDRTRTLSTSSALVEQNGSTTTTTTKPSNENLQTTVTNGRISSSSSNELTSPNHQVLPQRINQQRNFNGNSAGENYSNGHYQYYDESSTVNRGRVRNPNRNVRRTPPNSSLNHANSNRRMGLNYSETTNTYRRPRPAQAIVLPISN